jgi:hypothetical protein
MHLDLGHQKYRASTPKAATPFETAPPPALILLGAFSVEKPGNRADDERRKTDDERRKTDDERRKTDDDRRRTDDERQRWHACVLWLLYWFHTEHERQDIEGPQIEQWSTVQRCFNLDLRCRRTSATPKRE